MKLLTVHRRHERTIHMHAFGLNGHQRPVELRGDIEWLADVTRQQLRLKNLEASIQKAMPIVLA